MAVATPIRTMDHAPSVTSMIAADFGSVNTRVVMFDVVSGQYRLVSRAQTITTDAPPIVDVSVGLRRAVEEMSNLTGRALLNGEELIIGGRTTGVDMFLATASGGRPMKAVLVGLMPDVSVATGRRTLASTYVELCDTLSLADIRSQDDQINAIVRHQPDIILIVGGTNYGASDSVLSLLNTVRLAVLLMRDTRPIVVYAGNEVLRSTVNDMIGGEVALYMPPNVRPTLFDENLAPTQLELSLAYGIYKSVNPGGFGDIQSKTELGILPTAQSYSNMVRYLGELPGSGIGVLLVDVGSSTVTVCASVRKQTSVTIRSDLGLGHSALSGVKTVGAKNILRWLTYRATETDIMDYAYNKVMHPATVPQTADDLELEYAITRELIRAAVAGARPSWRGIPRGEVLPAMRPIIGAGSVLAQAVDPGVGALLMLDALQPTGVTELKVDPYGVLPALGAIAYVEPLSVVQILETGGLFDLATAICPFGKTRSNTAMDVTVKMAGGQTVQRSIATNTVQVVKVPAGQKAQVAIKLSPGLTLNGKRSLTLTVEGGAAGLIFDARGRPFTPPKDIERRAQLIPRWYTAVRSDIKEA